MATPPTGTVTFLFPDLEGSTRLWEEQREQMQRALARHDALLHETIERAGGHVFKTVGDAFCAVFADPAGAVAAALAAQQALATDGDLATGAGPLRVRMALHTGTAEQRGGDYFGPPLNRVARLLAAGHGGQVLLSEATCALVRDALPDGASLLDLGEHRLKDLIRPEHAFQLVAPDLPADFPPLRTLDRHPHNLPLQPTPLIGREREIREVTERLRRSEVRLLTLTGPGGTGKTRLALQAAAELADDFADGVYFVNLAPLSDPALVPSAIAQVLGVREAADRPLVETLTEYLRKEQILLVLDNFEQIAPAAPLVAGLLAASAGLKVLVTSRIPLHLRGEQEYPVPSLSLPDPKHLPPLERLTQYEAVRLFLERAQPVRPDFQVTNENAPAVVEICHRLDGLPLAIELAAARIRILPPQAMLSRLQSRLTLLTGGARDLPARQQTLRNTIEWSHELLGEEERVLFRRLSVFSGGRTLEAIEQVCNADGDSSAGSGQSLDVLEGVSSLVEKNLLRQEEESAEGEPRFVMLETIHDYAREKLQESGEAEEMGRRHTEFFLALAEEAEPQLWGPAQGRWFARLEAEHENLRAALARSLAQGEVEPAGRLAVALSWFWEVRGHIGEGRQWLGEVLAAEEISSRTRAKALLAAGMLAWRQGELAAAEPLLTESLSLSRELEDVRGIARALNGLGLLAAEYGDLNQAEAFYEEALARFRELGEKLLMAFVLNNLGSLAFWRQEYARAELLYRESLALRREVGDPAGTSLALLNLGDLARKQGDLPQARANLHESLGLARQNGHVQWATSGLAFLAQVLSAAGEAERAARLFGGVEARFTAMGGHLNALDRPEYDRDLAAARAQLEPAVWERLYQAGAAMTLEQAIAYALDEPDTEISLGPT